MFGCVLGCVSACGPAGAASDSPPTGSSLSNPVVSVEGWPPAPTASSSVLALAALIEGLEPLPPLTSRDAAWVEAVFLPWMQDREAAIAQARRIRRLAQREAVQERALCAGLYGALLQSTLESMAHARIDRLGPEAEEALTGSAETLADKSRRAYESCHQLALDSGVSLDAWRRACDQHLGRLPRG